MQIVFTNLPASYATDLQDLTPDIEIWKQLIYHKNKWLSKSLKTFIDYIKEKEF